MGVYKAKNTYHIADFYKIIMQQHPLQYQHQFVVEFIAPQGQTGRLSQGDNAFGRRDSSYTECFTYWVQSASIPKISVTNVTVPFLANAFVVPGSIKYEESWDVNVIIDQDLTQYKKLQAWQNLISNFSKSGGGKKVIPNVQAKASLLDNTMQKIQHSYILEGVWLKTLGALEGFAYAQGGTELQQCQATFEYQYFYPADDLENPTLSDPLSPNAVDRILNAASIYVN